MRINPDSTADLIAALARTQQAQETALAQISSGKRIVAPSDDPAGMAEWIRNRSRATNNDEFSHSIGTLKAMFHTADSTLNSVVSSLERAVSLGVRGANGSLSVENREAIALEVKGIRENIVGLANVAINGTYIFAGTETRTKPFVSDADASSMVRYQGNQGTCQVPIGESRLMQMNVPGDQIFAAAEADVFQSLQDLITSLEAGGADAISVATSRVRAAFDHVSGQRVFYGSALAQMASEETYLANEKLELARRENDIAGVDEIEAISRFVNAQAAHAAALEAAGKVSRLSLLDYIQ
ncbi:MAG TPA: flagellar hook-associated protein FlgL [Terriglobales bacterium]|nr:flagellar hook-associated protein FlgL [Terriglobales bacterium]